MVEALRSALRSFLHQVRPHESDDSRIVVAIRKVVIQRREAMPLARRLHALKLISLELMVLNISPIER